MQHYHNVITLFTVIFKEMTQLYSKDACIVSLIVVTSFYYKILTIFK